jgi:hypothetical protein
LGPLQFAVNAQLNTPDCQQVDPGFRLAGLDVVADAELPFPDVRRCRRPNRVFHALVIHGRCPPRPTDANSRHEREVAPVQYCTVGERNQARCDPGGQSGLVLPAGAERRLRPYFGGFSSLLVQPIASDLNGSHATILVSAWAHLWHSNLRCSKPSGPSETATVIIRVWQLGQRGQYNGNSSGSGLFVLGIRPK